MLFLMKSLSILFSITIFSFYLTKKSLFYTLLHSELLIIFFFSIAMVVGAYCNSIIALGLALCILILGSLEIALCLLLLLL